VERRRAVFLHDERKRLGARGGYGLAVATKPERPFTVKSLPERLRRLKNDPWGTYESTRRPLSFATR
jgi:hypothetical protein